MNVTIRNAVDSDKSFIYATWLLGLRHGNSWFKEIDKDVYFKRYKAIIDHLLSKATVKVACLNDDADVVLGYVVYRDNVLDWLFVKKAWRKLSIATQLLPKSIDTYSHTTKMVESFKPKEWKFNPFL